MDPFLDESWQNNEILVVFYPVSDENLLFSLFFFFDSHPSKCGVRKFNSRLERSAPTLLSIITLANYRHS